MAYKGLADFLEELASAGELARIDAEVNSHLEIAEITRRVADRGGPALLFQRVQDRSYAVLTNLLGTTNRACRLLGLDTLDDIPQRIGAVADQHTPRNWFDRLKMAPNDVGTDKFRPRATKAGACQQVVQLGSDVDLGTFPLLQCWPEETGPTITGGLLVTPSTQSTVSGLSHCTLVALDANRLAVVDHGQTAFANHWSEHTAESERMPVAMYLGCDPAAIIGTYLELPPEFELLHLVGLMRGKPIELVKCRSHDLHVPADAEIVIEGYLDPGAPRETISVGSAGGYYGSRQSAPVMQVTAVTHRHRPLFPAIINSTLDGETHVLAAARERMLRVTLRQVVPDIIDLSLPVLGGHENFAFVAFHKRSAFQARQVAAALWGTETLKFTKFLILVDESVDVQQIGQVWAQVGANVCPGQDIFSLEGPRRTGGQPDSSTQLAGRVAIDATSKWPTERAGGAPAILDAGEDIRRQVTARWPEFKLLQLPTTGR